MKLGLSSHSSYPQNLKLKDLLHPFSVAFRHSIQLILNTRICLLFICTISYILQTGFFYLFFFFLFRVSSIATIVIVIKHYSCFFFSLLFAFSIRFYIVYVRS